VGDRAAKDALFDGFALVGKALANGRRAEVLDVLAQGERHVEGIAEEIGQSVANTSFHLRGLAGAGLVATRPEGNRVYYRLSSERVATLWAALRDVAVAHHTGLDQLAVAYLGNRKGIEEVTREELAGRLGAAGLVVLDVRPTPEFASGHIAGARSVPVDELGAQVGSLPDGVEVVAYCRGRFCAFADDAVRGLRRRGYRARRLEDGFPEWRRAGHPIAHGLPA
jgi:rhodanese-related sulfurtransferase